PSRQLYIMMRRTTVVMLLILTATFLVFYLTVPKYRFDQPQAFNGSFIYNPYDSIQPEFWRKYNFNIQTNSWGGFPDGRKFSGDRIDSVYQLIGYDHITISDYQKINKFGNQLDRFLPSYKHGYGWNMPQQLCIGAEKVMWVDYPFLQTLDHKQSIIDKLNTDSRLIALTHPVHENGYDLVDMKYLSGYHLIEILNNKSIYTEHWDTALSNGHRIYLLANDHQHKVLSAEEMGKRFTMVNAPDLQMESIIDALEKGKVYGLDLFKAEEITNSNTSTPNETHPMLIAAKLKSDTFCVEVDKRAAFFRFIGQNGNDLSIIEDSTKATYVLSPEDTYVRTEITFMNGAVMYLNPLTRHATSNAERQVLAQIDHTKTAIYRGIYIVAIVFILQMIFKWQMRKIRLDKNE
ncbi:MAG: hypothetical protein Q8T08_16150, partial [Ignavibacteria bacterium]|nr:hypothetical protein [Ignavibacteria bacterium]